MKIQLIKKPGQFSEEEMADVSLVSTSLWIPKSLENEEFLVFGQILDNRIGGHGNGYIVYFPPFLSVLPLEHFKIVDERMSRLWRGVTFTPGNYAYSADGKSELRFVDSPVSVIWPLCLLDTPFWIDFQQNWDEGYRQIIEDAYSDIVTEERYYALGNREDDYWLLETLPNWLRCRSCQNVFQESGDKVTSICPNCGTGTFNPLFPW